MLSPYRRTRRRRRTVERLVTNIIAALWVTRMLVRSGRTALR